MGSSQHRRIAGRIATTIAIAGVATIGSINTAAVAEPETRPALSSTADQAMAEPVALDASHTERRTPNKPDLLLVAAVLVPLDLAKQYESIYFIADYHALTSIRDPKLLRHYTRSVAAAWMRTASARRWAAAPAALRRKAS